MDLFREKRWLPVLVVAFLVLAVILVVVVAGDRDAPAEDPSYEEELWGTAPEETLGVAVETPYMTFHYPEEWRGKVEAQLSEAEDCSITTFRTELSGKSVELFSVVLSRKAEEGYLLGCLRQEDGVEVNVYTRMNELSDEDWSEEEFDRLSALQERVNDIIAQFYENEAFQPDR